MSALGQYTSALNRFCADLSLAIGKAGETHDLERVEDLQDAVREAIANLSLLDFECGRIIAHG